MDYGGMDAVFDDTCGKPHQPLPGLNRLPAPDGSDGHGVCARSLVSKDHDEFVSGRGPPDRRGRASRASTGSGMPAMAEALLGTQATGAAAGGWASLAGSG